MTNKKEENKDKGIKPGGRKGGTKFPNFNLKQVLPNLKELKSKTHSKPITIEQLNAGVFKVKSNSIDGKIRYSSLKQFGLADGEYTEISSTELASQILLASEDERKEYLKQAFLNVPTFKNAFETFQDSTVAKSRIKNYAVTTLGVHIDLADKFVNSFIQSAEVASMCSIKGEDINFISAKEVKENDKSKGENDDNSLSEEEEFEESSDSNSEENEIDDDASNRVSYKPKSTKPNIDLKIDPTLDADKLEKQLKVLRKYGLI